MDKSWMNLPRPSKEYREGVKFFLDFAFEKSDNGLILCPCRKCKNGLNKTRDVVEGHLLWEGFLDGYIKWVLHGELYTNGGSPSYEYDRGNASDDIQGMLNDMFNNQTGDNHLEGATGAESEKPTAEAEKFYKLMEDAEQELYPGCTKFSKLSFIVRMLQIKCLGNWSNSSFTMMLNLLSEAFPDGAQLPKNYYETKKIMRDLGLDYKKIEACRNDCMLYWGEKESKTKCDTCDEPRWITPTQEEEPNAIEQDFISKKQAKKFPAKILWHFPLKPRLQRLFMNLKTASLMRWHKEERINDGVMRHPADSPTWQSFDYNNPEFAQDSRNVRLGLATDGFNPFRTMSVAHSTWLVILMPYNLPPGSCMKKSFFMLCLLIPGPTEPGNDLDVYLEPLIEELKELWHEGINTYDAALKQNFVMRAALLWTISDLPGHANISGWSTKGKYACPVCQKYTNSKRLRNSLKFCYMCHRVFLPRNHTYRKDKSDFDGTEELRKAPTYLKGSEILNEIKDFDNRFGKKVGDLGLPFNWKKKSIFFELPYWEKNLLRHNLDVMHVEKNVCDKVLYTLLDSDKSKDNHRARLDMKDMGIRPELWPFRDESGREWLPPSSFTLSKSEKEIFCKILKNIKVPDGYSSNVSRCVHLKPIKIFGLKSHDSHVLMQQLLPISLRKLLPKAVRSALIRLCGYFRELCSKTLRLVDLDRMEKEIPLFLISQYI